jgi:hypothetical protein
LAAGGGANWFLNPLALGPRDCFVIACVPALLCVGLAVRTSSSAVHGHIDHQP